jgi:hypothetical protein
VWWKNTAHLLILPLMSMLLSPGCATLTRRKTQRIPITSSPVGATVIVNGIERGVTPLEIGLVRKQKGQVIRIESPGYNPFEIRPQRMKSGGPKIGNILLGSIPAYVAAVAWYLAHGGSIYGSGNSDSDNTIVVLVLGTAAFGGLFTVIDSGGPGYALTPKELAVTLTKANGTPRVDTMLVNADDFQNIKWIRVRRD